MGPCKNNSIIITIIVTRIMIIVSMIPLVILIINITIITLIFTLLYYRRHFSLYSSQEAKDTNQYHHGHI